MQEHRLTTRPIDREALRLQRAPGQGTQALGGKGGIFFPFGSAAASESPLVS